MMNNLQKIENNDVGVGVGRISHVLKKSTYPKSDQAADQIQIDLLGWV